MQGGIATSGFERTTKDRDKIEVNLHSRTPKDLGEAINIIKILDNELDRLKKEKFELFTENVKLKRQLEKYEFEVAVVEKWAAKMKRLFNKGA